MVLLRRSTQWASLLRHHSAKSIRSSIGSRTWQQSLRRGYASEGGHGAQQASSDLPWLVGAIVVTVPSTYYILKPNPNKDHGHGHGEGGHEEHEEHEESEEHVEAEAEEKTGEEAEDKQDGDGGNTEPSEGEGETSEDSESDDGAAQDTPETSDDDEPKNVAHETEGGGNVEGVQFKGATKGGEQGDTRKHIPDAKGFNKKRIESHYGNRLGAADEESEEDIDTPSASKPAGSITGSQSGKQEGLSNTDTKHSTDIGNDPEKSKKGEGTPETSKSKGTVDPKRPQV